eukprot:scaffold6655_cov188-Prasinococcus_capsulatus_cf.AAC.2
MLQVWRSLFADSFITRNAAERHSLDGAAAGRGDGDGDGDGAPADWWAQPGAADADGAGGEVKYESGSFCLARTKLYHLLLHSKAKYMTFLSKQVDAIKRQHPPRAQQREVDAVVERFARAQHHRLCHLLDLAGTLYLSTTDMRGKIDAVLGELDDMDPKKLKYHDVTPWLAGAAGDSDAEAEAEEERDADEGADAVADSDSEGPEREEQQRPPRDGGGSPAAAQPPRRSSNIVMSDSEDGAAAEHTEGGGAASPRAGAASGVATTGGGGDDKPHAEVVALSD